MNRFLKGTTAETIAQARKDNEVYKKNALPLKAEGTEFSHDVIGKDCTGLLGIICYDYEEGEWMSHTDQFNIENDFVWSYPTKSLMDAKLVTTEE